MKDKKIKTNWAVFTMTCLEFVLDEINPLGFLHLDMEGWRPTPWGPESHSAALTIPDSLFVRCGMIGIGTGGILPSGTLMDSGIPATMSSLPWRNIQNSSGLTTSSIRIVIYAFTSGGRNIWGGADDDAVKLFCVLHSASSYSRNTKGRKTTTNRQNLPIVSSITTKFDQSYC